MQHLKAQIICLLLAAFLLSSCILPDQKAITLTAPSSTPAQLALQQPNIPTTIATLIPTLAAASPTASPTSTPTSTRTPEPTASPTPPPTATTIPSPTANPQLDPNVAAREQLMLEIINQIRVQANLPPYQRDVHLDDVARAHSCDMASHHFMGHDSSDGRTAKDRIQAVNPDWTFPSESVAAGSDDAQVIVNLWMDEPPDGWHRRNILDPDKSLIGIGYCHTEEDPTNNHDYWTMDVVKG